MELIKIDEFDEVYHLFSESFPEAELRPYEYTKNLFEHDAFYIYALKSNNKLQGAMIVWQIDHRLIYIENFAIDVSQRGGGLGSIMLTDIKQQFVNQTIILEVEVPEDEMSQRRVAFYERNGFTLNPYHYIQPSFYQHALPIDLMLMSYPGQIDSQYDFDIIKKQIFRIVYQQTI